MKKITIALCLGLTMLIGACGTSAKNATGEKLAAGQAAAQTVTKLKYQVTSADAPKVFFIKKVSPESLVKVYEAVGRMATGKVGLKLSFESPGGPYLPPTFLKPLRDKVNGTFIDSNGFSAPRNTNAGNLQVAKDHGFTAVGPVDVLDAEGELDMPVVGGKHLKIHRTGSHFANYDSVISLVRFKPHHIRDYGGTLKNLTICLASISGKAILHSGGKVESGFTEDSIEVFLESMADGVKAAEDYKKDHWVYINVLSAIDPDDSCSDAKAQQDIGILASVDPVALDQAAVDMTFGAAPDEKTREEWEEIHHTRVLGYAEAIGAGKRNYQLVEIQ
jgi:uncharacterized Fe-S center protein